MIRTKLLISLLLLTLASLPACKSKTVVRKISNDENTPIKSFNGVPYRLPRTVVSVTVPVKLTQIEPGPFVQYQPCFFPRVPENGVVRKENRKIQVQPPTFDSFGEPDPTENYIVSIKGGIFENKSLLMEFSPRGVLKKGEASSEDKSVEFTLKAIQTATAIGGAIIKTRDLGVTEDTSKTETRNCYQQTLDFYANAITAKEKLFEVADASQKTELEALIGEIKEFRQKVEESHKLVNKLIEKDATPTEVIAAQDTINNYSAAKQAFANLTDLIKRRDNMVSSPSDASGDSFKVRLAETDKSIDSYRQLFLGISSETVWNAPFQYRPGARDIQYSKPLLVFIPAGVGEGKSAGICPRLGLVQDDGVLPPAKFRSDDCGAPADRELQAVWIKLVKDGDDAVYLRKIAAVNKTYADNNKERGWHFRIAAKGNLFFLRSTVKLADIAGDQYMNAKSPTEVARTNMLIAQLGVVASIPASGGGRSQQSALELNGITGELVNFKYTSTSALDKERLSEVQSSVENVANATDPLAKKKRELEKLKTEKEIRDLNANLNPQP